MPNADSDRQQPGSLSSQTPPSLANGGAVNRNGVKLWRTGMTLW